METTGRFDVVSAGDISARCGLLGSAMSIAFKVVIASSPAHLDDNGFIIDWQEIHEYFADTYREVAVFPSCERIACRACTDIAAMLGEKCNSIEVTIGSGKHAAGMKARWSRLPQPI